MTTVCYNILSTVSIDFETNICTIFPWNIFLSVLFSPYTKASDKQTILYFFIWKPKSSDKAVNAKLEPDRIYWFRHKIFISNSEWYFMYMHLNDYNGNKGLSFICHPSCIVSLYIHLSVNCSLLCMPSKNEINLI